jgi:Niemann-Pick C1 protein
MGLPALILSYCAMFLFLSFALGRLFPIRDIYVFTETKFALGNCSIASLVLIIRKGLGAVSLVLCSLAMSLGICSVIGIKETFLISLVIPFLLLAIGVDNIFILVDTYDNTDPLLEVFS